MMMMTVTTSYMRAGLTQVTIFLRLVNWVPIKLKCVTALENQGYKREVACQDRDETKTPVSQEHHTFTLDLYHCLTSFILTTVHWYGISDSSSYGGVLNNQWFNLYFECLDQYQIATMKRMTNVLRKFHLMKEPPESEMRQRLKAELFACNSVSVAIIPVFSMFLNIKLFYEKNINVEQLTNIAKQLVLYYSVSMMQVHLSVLHMNTRS